MITTIRTSHEWEAGCYWLNKNEELILFEVVHPKEANGTDGTPMIRLSTFRDGEMLMAGSQWKLLEDARELWGTWTDRGWQQVETEWDEVEQMVTIIK